MESQTLIIDNSAISKNERLVQIRKKIKDVFGWECTMNDDMLVKFYSITIDRGIGHDIKIASFHSIKACVRQQIPRIVIEEEHVGS